MKKIIFGVFAHPDDEAFIVAGTLLKEVRAGAEIHLVCFTDGAGGTNPDNMPDLGMTRLEEWRAAGKLLGATSMRHLGFQDGKLCNTDMIEAAARIETIVRDTLEDRPEQMDIEFIAFDLNGLTGHIDHIVASRAACLAFRRLASVDQRFVRLRLACLPREIFPTTDINWLYMEPGRPPEDIDEIIDACDLRSEIIEVMHVHKSQRHDGETMIQTFGDRLGMNYFRVIPGQES